MGRTKRNPDGRGCRVLEGGSVQAELQAWQVASAANTDGSTIVGQGSPKPPLSAPSSAALTSAVSSKTAGTLLRIAGRVRLTAKVRARIVLLSSYGASKTEIASATRATPAQIATVISDYNSRGLASLR